MEPHFRRVGLPLGTTTPLLVTRRPTHYAERWLPANLMKVISALREVLPATVHTGLIRCDQPVARPPAHSHDVAATLDHLQSVSQQSPSRTALRERRPIVVAVDTDQRWPDLTATARELGVREIVCLPLIRAHRHLGVFTLYAYSRPLFTPIDTSTAGAHAVDAPFPEQDRAPEARSPVQLTISISTHSDSSTTVALSGEIDAHTAPRLRILLLLPAEDLDIDLSGISFLGLAGITFFLDLRSHLLLSGSTLRLTAVPPIVRRLISLACLDDVLLDLG